MCHSVSINDSIQCVIGTQPDSQPDASMHPHIYFSCRKCFLTRTSITNILSQKLYTLIPKSIYYKTK